MDLGLSGRVYVLTGASRGLGFATAKALVADGAKVVISSRDQARVEAAIAELNRERDEPARGVAADLADADTPGLLLQAAQDAFGRVDGALISVGGPPRGTAAEVTDDHWRAAFESVFLGSVRMARTVLGVLEPGGAVGFVLSTSARSPVNQLGLSNGLRPGLAGVAKDMADEFGPKGLRVFGLLPGMVDTERVREILAGSGDSAAATANATAQIPLRRLGEPDEFGRVGAFLLSPAASYLTGLLVPVDGGSTRAL
jgi:3-oxoacyl-[acyl-carrier protein] reductase